MSKKENTIVAEKSSTHNFQTWYIGERKIRGKFKENSIEEKGKYR